MTSRPIVIVNPAAGGGSAGRGLDGFLTVVERALGPLDVEKTERPRHAVDIAERAAREGREIVVATGGDGSVHEVANGLLRAREAGFTQASLGIISRGTGGDFCRTLGLDHRLERYLAAIAARTPRLVDVGRLRYAAPDGARREDYFINILSGGLGGLVDKYVHRHAQWAGGKAGYFIAAAQALLESERGIIHVRYELDGVATEEEIPSWMIAICNGRYFGAGMLIAPMAELDDGAFEVVSLGQETKLQFVRANNSAYSGGHLRDPRSRHFRCQKISLEVLNDRARACWLLDVDGEPLGAPPLEVELMPLALPVLAPV